MRVEEPLVVLCATFLIYNAQRLFLTLFSRTHQNLIWYQKNSKILIGLMGVALVGLYPVLWFPIEYLVVDVLSLILGILYFLPGFELRKIPVIKSMTVGIVWALVCIQPPHMTFCSAQAFLITALCVVFNIRDLEHDQEQGTKTLAVLMGVPCAKSVGCILIGLYAWIALGYTPQPWVVTAVVSVLSGCVVCYSSPKQHPFYYLFGTDGIILIQTLLGICYLRGYAI